MSTMTGKERELYTAADELAAATEARHQQIARIAAGETLDQLEQDRARTRLAEAMSKLRTAAINYARQAPPEHRVVAQDERCMDLRLKDALVEMRDVGVAVAREGGE